MVFLRFFKDLGGLDPLENEPRGDQNQSLEAKRPKVGAKLGPSAGKIRKKKEKSRKPRGLGPQKAPAISRKSAVQPRAHIRGGSPPYKYLSKLRYKQQLLQTAKNLSI